VLPSTGRGDLIWSEERFQTELQISALYCRG